MNITPQIINLEFSKKTIGEGEGNDTQSWDFLKIFFNVDHCFNCSFVTILLVLCLKCFEINCHGGRGGGTQ